MVKNEQLPICIQSAILHPIMQVGRCRREPRINRPLVMGEKKKSTTGKAIKPVTVERIYIGLQRPEADTLLT